MQRIYVTKKILDVADGLARSAVTEHAGNMCAEALARQSVEHGGGTTVSSLHLIIMMTSTTMGRVPRGGGGRIAWSRPRMVPHRAQLCTLLSVLLAIIPSRSYILQDTIAWFECPEGQGGNECARIPLPLDPDDGSNNHTVSAFVRRFYAEEGPTASSLWMFAGGPGDSAQSFADAAAYFITLDPSVTVYLMDQRGVGMSLPSLTCASPPLYQFGESESGIIRSITPRQRHALPPPSYPRPPSPM